MAKFLLDGERLEKVFEAGVVCAVLSEVMIPMLEDVITDPPAPDELLPMLKQYVLDLQNVNRQKIEATVVAE